ncbi:ABC transporter permease [Corynebacterium lowii]|uniref:ABC-2 family transporter protein n=1 Tax=Corynebacterium lowii TaxID=1544413 RepID=A0A0Q1AHB7_9CORY|nr:ABC transporter permease [Corynebacterium lowii]KQB86063.1 ABC-2 family transporter protein [Corynebacterium lowii]MDP9852535.1 ABC-2 type transport system permease protein [Corynebacterium lowii]
MTITVPRPMTSTHTSRIISLTRAESTQMLRNKTLLYMMSTPLLMGLVMAFLGKDVEIINTALLFEMPTLFALLFCAYYLVLSMSTTRRDEKVLKRLRTGESTDTDILVSLGIGPVLATIGTVALSGGILLAVGVPVPDNPLLLLVAIPFGTVLSWGLALLTSIITRNAEAAQMTSMPLTLIILLSQKGLRDLLPDTAARIAEFTPYAAVSDLVNLSWAGGGEYLQPILVLVAWTALCSWAGMTFMKWENDR